MDVRVSTRHLCLLGSGSVLPGPRVSTEAMCAHIRRHSDQRRARKAAAIARRLGVRGRHLARDLALPVEAARPEHTNPRLAATAVRAALREAQVGIAALGYLVGHTASPHTQLPPSVAWAADELRYAGPFAELRQACTGFANALQLAGGLLAEPGAAPIAIVGSETGSLHAALTHEFLDDEQLINTVQMGDGAGAVVLAGEAARDGAVGVLEATWFGSLGLGRAPGFWMDGAPGAGGPVAAFRHDFAAVRAYGPELFRAGIEVAARLGHPVGEVEHVLPHQANGRMPELLADELGVPAERVVGDGAELGNLGSASVWVSFDRLRRSGRLAPGERVLVLGAEATKCMYGGFVYRHGSLRP